jgi:hypothetical protein
VSYLYFVQAGSNHPDHPIKIGYATNLRARMSAIQTGCPVELRFVTSILLDDMSPVIEKRLHEAFRVVREHGEWFAPHPRICETIPMLRRFQGWNEKRSMFALKETLREELGNLRFTSLTLDDVAQWKRDLANREATYRRLIEADERARQAINTDMAAEEHW